MVNPVGFLCFQLPPLLINVSSTSDHSCNSALLDDYPVYLRPHLKCPLRGSGHRVSAHDDRVGSGAHLGRVTESREVGTTLLADPSAGRIYLIILYMVHTFSKFKKGASFF